MIEKEKNFLYQINFNRKKYPEICEALEEAKEDNGVAWYLRGLISKDIENKTHYKKLLSNGSEQISQSKNNYYQQRQEEVNNEEVLPDNNGGFC